MVFPYNEILLVIQQLKYGLVIDVATKMSLKTILLSARNTMKKEYIGST
jgi:hypothetical protein